MRVIILVGLPGSGKSTIAKTRFPNYYRINQDELGSRDKCVERFKEVADAGKDIIIDRCNTDKFQRRLWIKLALDFDAESIDCIYLDINEEEAVARSLNRNNHPTMSNLPLAKLKQIVYNFSKDMEIPTLDENFTSILFIRT